MARYKVTPRPTTSTPVEAVRHKDKRRNIPTEELRDFVAEDEARPKTLLYPRDPSLDPAACLEGQGRSGPPGPGRPRRPRLHPGEDSAAGHHRERAEEPPSGSPVNGGGSAPGSPVDDRGPASSPPRCRGD